jgi:hypothetical protein
MNKQIAIPYRSNTCKEFRSVTDKATPSTGTLNSGTKFLGELFKAVNNYQSWKGNNWQNNPYNKNTQPLNKEKGMFSDVISIYEARMKLLKPNTNITTNFKPDKQNQIDISKYGGVNPQNKFNQIQLAVPNKWISQYDKNLPGHGDEACFIACNTMLNKYGVISMGGFPNGTQMVKEINHQLVNQSQNALSQGINYINSQLQNNKPVILGVSYPNPKNGTLPGGNNGLSDHAVLIVGMGYDESKQQNYFNYYDPGASTESKTTAGVNLITNRLYLNSDGTITAQNYFNMTYTGMWVGNNR